MCPIILLCSILLHLYSIMFTKVAKIKFNTITTLCNMGDHGITITGKVEK